MSDREAFFAIVCCLLFIGWLLSVAWDEHKEDDE